MNLRKKDTLLAVAQVLLALCIALLIFVMAMILIGLGALLTVGRGEVMAELAAAHAPDSAYWAVVGVMVLAEGLLYVVLRFVIELHGILKSVDRGDPFEPENARRLSRMGWLMVGAYALSFVISSISAWIKLVSGEAGKDIDVDVGLGGGSGLLLILVLFILARVFRHGSAMREDLEGTV